jgi:hypothetical protein
MKVQDPHLIVSLKTQESVKEDSMLSPVKMQKKGNSPICRHTEALMNGGESGIHAKPDGGIMGDLTSA